jgi:cysteine dioxygenase
MTLEEEVRRRFGPLKQPTSEELAEALESMHCTEGRITPYASQPEELPYGRSVLMRTDDVEVVVVHLPAFTETAIHDHGGSLCLGRLVTGEVHERKFGINAEGLAEERMVFKLRPGDPLTADIHTVHQLRNVSLERALMLNVYSPPISAARTYDVALLVEYFI